TDNGGEDGEEDQFLIRHQYFGRLLCKLPTARKTAHMRCSFRVRFSGGCRERTSLQGLFSTHYMPSCSTLYKGSKRMAHASGSILGNLHRFCARSLANLADDINHSYR